MSLVQDIKRFDVPIVKRSHAWWYLVLNVIIPGAGTMIAGMDGGHSPTTLIGVIQIVIYFFLLWTVIIWIIDWIWALYYRYFYIQVYK